MMKHKSFAAFILTHGRADRVMTYHALKNGGYTGRIIILIDNEDKTRAEYEQKFGDMVHVFDKEAIARTFDRGDNSGEKRAIVFARNACWEIARELGLEHYAQLDDDYTDFRFKMDSDGKFTDKHNINRKLDSVFDLMIDFVEQTGAHGFSLAQGGDFIGGGASSNATDRKMLRKCMNTWICTTARPFKFVGRMNEDVTAYVVNGHRGMLFATTPHAAINQVGTQQASGGMTSVYQDNGTYIKSFFTILYAPSCTTIATIGYLYPRLHHRISWKNAVPKIVSEEVRKPR